MKEYTLLAFLSAIAAVVLDHVLGVRVTRRRPFWVFLAVMVGFKLIVNGYLTWRPVVLYHDPFYLGFRLGTIPVEDFLYGFGLMTMSVVVWEYFLHRRTAGR